MGSVYRAHHVELGVERAVKLLGLDGSLRLERFRREIEHLARVRHPNVIAIHEAGVLPTAAWYAMDLIEGRSLRDVLDEEGPIPPARALALADAMASGLQALHEVGVAHRDFKPENVVLRPDGSPVLIDLGLAVARADDSRLTQTGAMVGTFHYMAPEQLVGEPAGPAADVFAWGLVVAELLMGSLPSRELPYGTPRPLSRLAPNLPRAVDEALALSWRALPDERPSLSELRGVLAGDRRRGSRRARLRLRLALGSALLVLSAAGLWALSMPPPPPGPSSPAPRASSSRRPGPDLLRSARAALTARKPLRLLERLGALDAAALRDAASRALRDEAIDCAEKELRRGLDARALDWLGPLGLLEGILRDGGGRPFAEAVTKELLRRILSGEAKKPQVCEVLETLARSKLPVRAREVELVLDELFVLGNAGWLLKAGLGRRILRAAASLGVDPSFDHLRIAANSQPLAEDALGRYLQARIDWTQAHRSNDWQPDRELELLRRLTPEEQAALPPRFRVRIANLAARSAEPQDKVEHLSQARDILRELPPTSSARLRTANAFLELSTEVSGELRERCLKEGRELLEGVEPSPRDLLEHPSLRLAQLHTDYLSALVLMGQRERAQAHVESFRSNSELHQTLRLRLEAFEAPPPR
jgi:serine/threonine protein kinase